MSFAQQDTNKRIASMGTAIALNGGIIVAIMLSPLIVIPKAPRIGTDAVNVKPPVTPIEPEVVPQADDPLKIEPVYTPEKARKTKDDLETVTTTQDDTGHETGTGGTSDTGKGGGSETVREIVEDPPLPPLMHAKRDPRFARNFLPDYPSGLLAKEIEGEAVLKVLVGTDGRVREAIIVRASHPDFGKAAAKQALKEWRFIAATRGGTPVEDWQTIPIRYTIES